MSGFQCPEEGEEEGLICEGGDVYFNKSHPNFIHSLAVENHWMCSKVKEEELSLWDFQSTLNKNTWKVTH